MPTDLPIEPEGRYFVVDETYTVPTDFAGYKDRIGPYLQSLMAEADELAARKTHERALRPRLRWLVDHPRLLDWAYRLRLATRPTMPWRLSTTNAFDGLENASADQIRADENALLRARDLRVHGVAYSMPDGTRVDPKRVSPDA